MATKPGNRDRRLLPYKVAVQLLYGYCHGMDRVTGDSLVLETSAVANHLGLSNARLRGYLEDLLQLGVLEDLSLGHGYAKVKLATPAGFAAAVGE